MSRKSSASDPLIARRVFLRVTARALRHIAQQCDLAKIRIVEEDAPPTAATSGSALPSSSCCWRPDMSRPFVTPMQRPDCTRPPGNPHERWLLEWQPDVRSGPWPIMTTRLSERQTSAGGALACWRRRWPGRFARTPRRANASSRQRR